jgi:hypothetical protein
MVLRSKPGAGLRGERTPEIAVCLQMASAVSGEPCGIVALILQIGNGAPRVV